MTDERVRLGRLSEQRVAQLMSSMGYRILTRNYRAANGELDIVCQREDTLFVVEVRSRKLGVTRPIETITIQKQKNLFSAVEAFMARFTPDVEEVRFIVAEVDWQDDHPRINLVFDPFI